MQIRFENKEDALKYINELAQSGIQADLMRGDKDHYRIHNGAREVDIYAPWAVAVYPKIND